MFYLFGAFEYFVVLIDFQVRFNLFMLVCFKCSVFLCLSLSKIYQTLFFQELHE